MDLRQVAAAIRAMEADDDAAIDQQQAKKQQITQMHAALQRCMVEIGIRRYGTLVSTRAGRLTEYGAGCIIEFLTNHGYLRDDEPNG